jgi:hypothetical protein
LLDVLGITPEQVQVDPTRTLIKMSATLWTLVNARSATAAPDSPSQRRAGAKHKRVR